MFWSPVPVESINEPWGAKSYSPQDSDTPDSIQESPFKYWQFWTPVDFFSEKMLLKVFTDVFAHTSDK